MIVSWTLSICVVCTVKITRVPGFSDDTPALLFLPSAKSKEPERVTDVKVNRGELNLGKCAMLSETFSIKLKLCSRDDARTCSRAPFLRDAGSNRSGVSSCLLFLDHPYWMICFPPSLSGSLVLVNEFIRREAEVTQSSNAVIVFDVNLRAELNYRR